MSRVDLNQIQSQLKSAIQNHQILVSKLKLNPQDMGLKKQLHNAQRDIIEMSEKQKLIVQRLKTEIVERQPSTSAQQTSLTAQPPMAVHAITPQPPMTCQPTDLSKKSAPRVEPKGASSPPSFKPDIENKPPKSASPPIRVPEYPRNRPSMLKGNTSYRPQVSNVGVAQGTKRSYSETLYACRDIRKSVEKKQVNPEEKKKLEFMAVIDLITPDTLKEMQGRRTERKRRSTYNPNFSYGIELERRPRIPAFLAAALAEPKKPRGRPKSSPSPNTSRASTPDVAESVSNSETDPTDKTEKVHDSLCAVCSTGGRLLLCDTCSCVYHLQCLSPPQEKAPEGRWSCPKCQISSQKSSESLAAVNAYISSKSAKEEEKRKLLKRSSELLQEKTDLQNRTQQLNEVLAQQGIKKQEIIDINKKAQQSVENLKNFVKMVQSS